MNIAERLSTKLGPLPVWAWGGIGALAVWLIMSRGGSLAGDSSLGTQLDGGGGGAGAGPDPVGAQGGGGGGGPGGPPDPVFSGASTASAQDLMPPSTSEEPTLKETPWDPSQYTVGQQYYISTMGLQNAIDAGFVPGVKSPLSLAPSPTADVSASNAVAPTPAEIVAPDHTYYPYAPPPPYHPPEPSSAIMVSTPPVQGPVYGFPGSTAEDSAVPQGSYNPPTTPAAPPTYTGPAYTGNTDDLALAAGAARQTGGQTRLA